MVGSGARPVSGSPYQAVHCVLCVLSICQRNDPTRGKNFLWIHRVSIGELVDRRTNDLAMVARDKNTGTTRKRVSSGAACLEQEVTEFSIGEFDLCPLSGL